MSKNEIPVLDGQETPMAEPVQNGEANTKKKVHIPRASQLMDVTPAPIGPDDAEEEAAPMPSMQSLEQEALLASLRSMAKDPKNAPRAQAPRPGVFRSKRPGQGHTIDNEVFYEDPETVARRKAEIAIYQSYLKKRVLKGRLIGIKQAYDSEGPGNITYYAIVMVKLPDVDYTFEVIIPYLQFTDADFESLWHQQQTLDPNKTLEASIHAYLTSRMNAEVDFTISNIERDEDTGKLAIAGDRVDAMYRQRVYHWFGTDRTTGEYKLNVGSKVEARIISTSRLGVRIEVFGVETFIRNKDLDYTFIQDARTEFENGTRKWAIITALKRDPENDYFIEFAASIRDAKPDPRARGMSVFLEGSTFVGEINFIQVPTPERPNVRPSVFVKLPHAGVQVCCPFPNGQVAPERGAQCYVTITNRDLQRNQLYGKINHIVPSGSM